MIELIYPLVYYEDMTNILVQQESNPCCALVRPHA